MFFANCRPLALFLFLLVLSITAPAINKPHVLTFGKWSTQWFPDSSAADDKPIALKVRSLLVDARVKEFTLGQPHDVTDRLFVIRRAYRVNDSLPQESTAPPHWQWQRGGWLLADRLTGHISPVALPEFDAFYSVASWYRDYAAYCGISEDGKKVFAIVAQLGRRKPLLKKLLDGAYSTDQMPESARLLPNWQRSPARVSFELAGSKQTFAVRGHTVDLVNDAEDDDEEASK